MDLTEAEEIKKRWPEYTEELCKKGLNDLDDHNGVVTHLEPDILACEVKWALGRITTNKARGGDGIPAELFFNPERCCCESAALGTSSAPRRDSTEPRPRGCSVLGRAWGGSPSF